MWKNDQLNVGLNRQRDSVMKQNIQAIVRKINNKSLNPF